MIAATLALILAASALQTDDAPPDVPATTAAEKAASAEEARKLAASKKAGDKAEAPPEVPATTPPPQSSAATPAKAAPAPAKTTPAKTPAAAKANPPPKPDAPPAAAPKPTDSVTAPADAEPADTSVPADAAADSYTPPPQSGAGAANTSGLTIGGYADIGFARAKGDGTSFPVNDTRIPADYGVDAFAPAINSRGDVASTDSKGRLTNGFLPRSMGIGGVGSFVINTVDLDVKYQPSSAPVLLFSRLQVLPRFNSGTDTRFLVEQAFARVIPFSSAELALFVGKFDPVFGIEYLENEANLRTGVTPSLISRYTTGQELGVKGFYRFQIPGIWSALSLNAAATNGSSLIEPLQPADVSLTGAPVLSARLGYELNLPSLQIKLGASGMRGPRNDQHQRDVRQWAWGVDARAAIAGFSLSAELIHVQQDPGADDKIDGLGAQTSVSGFSARGGYVTAAYGAVVDLGPLHKATLYGRYGRRYAQFEGYTPISVDRITVGARLDLWESVAVKAEGLINRERFGAPQVDNDVFTSSVVYSF